MPSEGRGGIDNALNMGAGSTMNPAVRAALTGRPQPRPQAALPVAAAPVAAPVVKKANPFFDGTAQAGLGGRMAAGRPGNAGLGDAAAAEEYKSRYGKYPRWFQGGAAPGALRPGGMMPMMGGRPRPAGGMMQALAGLDPAMAQHPGFGGAVRRFEK